MIDYNDPLAEYLSADEHIMHAQYSNCITHFHQARAEAKRARAEGRQEDGDAFDMKAAEYARIVEGVNPHLKAPSMPPLPRLP